jgi:hypothetical protein
MSFKLFLWKLGLYENCPYCGGRLNGHGYDNTGNSPGFYTCKNEKCKFNEVEK